MLDPRRVLIHPSDTGSRAADGHVRVVLGPDVLTRSSGPCRLGAPC
jgi:hypothetical protein